MIVDTAGCGRCQGSPLRSDERAGERAPLTATAPGQKSKLSGAKEKKKKSVLGMTKPERRFNKSDTSFATKTGHRKVLRHI